MNRIELSAYDKEDLLKILEYAKGKFEEDRKNKVKTKYDKWDDSTWWEIRIDQLRMVINGYVSTPSIQSSLTSDIPSNLKEKQQWRYKQSLESDLDDLIDYFDKKKGEDSLY